MNYESPLSDPASRATDVAEEPPGGPARYVFAAELAQAGRYEEAAAEMERALVQSPGLHTARLQLGLLKLTAGKSAEALQTWSPLELLDDADPIKHFKRGLESLATDDFAACIMRLEEGIRLNKSNDALNRDMAMIVERVRAALPARLGTSASPRPANTPGARARLAAYEADPD